MDLPRRTVDAVRMTNDALRLYSATDGMLTGAAILIAKAITTMEGRGGSKQLRAQALDMLDNAGQAIAGELKRRQQFGRAVRDKTDNAPARP